MSLDVVYHWSPSANRESILQVGLQVYSNNVVHTCGRAPYLCFGSTPSNAWRLSAAMDWVQDHESWDLWQVLLTSVDSVRVTMDGCSVYEIRTENSIPVDRVWFVGRREPLFFQPSLAEKSQG